MLLILAFRSLKKGYRHNQAPTFAYFIPGGPAGCDIARKAITVSRPDIYWMYHVYEYEATKTCPECSEQETVPVAAYVDEETGRRTIMAKKVKCERHQVTGVSRCGLSDPIGAVTEISMTDSDAYDYMVQKIREGYNISSIQR